MASPTARLQSIAISIIDAAEPCTALRVADKDGYFTDVRVVAPGAPLHHHVAGGDAVDLEGQA